MKKYVMMILGLLIFLTAPGCSGSGESESGSVQLLVAGHEFRTEIADSPDERRRGYMERENIGPDEAMLFVFASDQKLSFWMKNTPTPLSIAYIDSAGVIREIHDMEPYSERSVPSRVSVRFALEVVQGRFEELGIVPGDRIEIPGGELPVTRE